MHKRIGFMLALIGGIVMGFAAPALATKPPQHLVTICHASPPDTAANGWVQITVDVASVGYQHSGHESEHDADIIPPYSYGDFSYAGKNWTEAGQAVWNNGCELPGTTTTTTQPVTTTTVQCDCESTTTTEPVTTTTTETTISAPTTTLPVPPTTHVPSTTAPVAPSTAPTTVAQPSSPPSVKLGPPTLLAHTGTGAMVTFWIGFVILMLGLGIVTEQWWHNRRTL